jgi:hypothetical protein
MSFLAADIISVTVRFLPFRFAASCIGFANLISRPVTAAYFVLFEFASLDF